MQHDYEKLGSFYLGRGLDIQSGDATADTVLYDSRDLTTHGVIIGMTGSGKTGLGIGLLEEAAMDRIPVIAVDPKGDLTNLLLTFPDLAPADFEPWVDDGAARRQGMDRAAYAAQQAELWRTGLADWDQDGDRIRRLREHADFAIYTPGSSAGLPVSVLRSFDAPPPELVADADGLRERIQSAVTGLLGLAGIDADPIRSREHILISTILDGAWREGRSLDLGALIQAIQQPPFTRLGVMELENIYPSKDRFALAMQLNGLLASPGFQAWMEGEPLDISAMLYTPQGHPRVTIFSIAHLGDAERMFFVTILLSALVGWIRSQAGTTSLRALLYMDEIFGFFPPTANPPSKAPMLTLLKQARAYGVGVVLATQNPVDLDYKGLGNTGTWFIGRLQTDRDKLRVLDALDGAMAGSNPMPRAELDRMISGLGKRVFLMHNVHRGAPTLLATRWVMSYLAGPMTLSQIRRLTDSGSSAADGSTTTSRSSPSNTGMSSSQTPSNTSSQTPSNTSSQTSSNTSSQTSSHTSPQTTSRSGAPLLPREIRQLFAPPFARAADLQYRPSLLVAAEVRYTSSRHGVDETRMVGVLVPLEDGNVPFALERATADAPSLDILEAGPIADAAFAPLPAEAAQPRSYARWAKDVVRWIQSAQPITLYESRSLKVCSKPGETERDFRMRLADLDREARDGQAERLRQKYEPRFRTMQERQRRAEQAVEKRTAESRQATLNTGLSVLSAVLGAASGGKGKGASGGLLGAFLGRGAARSTTAVRTAGRAAKSRQGVAHAAETVEAVQASIAELEAEFQDELGRLSTSVVAEEPLGEVVVRPALNAISVRVAGLAWLPWGTGPDGAPVPLWR
ncbi:DUF87 domain-containing protein [soil metagenome]